MLECSGSFFVCVEIPPFDLRETRLDIDFRHQASKRFTPTT